MEYGIHWPAFYKPYVRKPDVYILFNTFRMDFRDFVQVFDTIDLCHLPPDAPLVTHKKWKVHEFHGSWQAGVNAGGRPVCQGM